MIDLTNLRITGLNSYALTKGQSKCKVSKYRILFSINLSHFEIEDDLSPISLPPMYSYVLCEFMCSSISTTWCTWHFIRKYLEIPSSTYEAQKRSDIIIKVLHALQMKQKSKLQIHDTSQLLMNLSSQCG